MSEQKIALCLHGYFGTLSENNFETSAGGYEHIKERLLSNNLNTLYTVGSLNMKVK